MSGKVSQGDNFSFSNKIDRIVEEWEIIPLTYFAAHGYAYVYERIYSDLQRNYVTIDNFLANDFDGCNQIKMERHVDSKFEI